MGFGFHIGSVDNLAGQEVEERTVEASDNLVMKGLERDNLTALYQDLNREWRLDMALCSEDLGAPGTAGNDSPPWLRATWMMVIIDRNAQMQKIMTLETEAIRYQSRGATYWSGTGVSLILTLSRLEVRS